MREDGMPRLEDFLPGELDHLIDVLGQEKVQRMFDPRLYEPRPVEELRQAMSAREEYKQGELR